MEYWKTIEKISLSKCSYIKKISMFDRCICNTKDGIISGIITQINTKGITFLNDTKAYFVKYSNVIGVSKEK